MLSSLGANTAAVSPSVAGSVLVTTEQVRVSTLKARIGQLFLQKRDASEKMQRVIRNEIVACSKAVRKLEKSITAHAQSRMQYAGGQADNKKGCATAKSPSPLNNNSADRFNFWGNSR